MSQGILGKIKKLRCKSLDVGRHLDCFTSLDGFAPIAYRTGSIGSNVP
ncbi:MAG: hypothetical protein JGK17_30535 [Microcoleus sp. PH2017_10_PVI_O_A]|nr:MULTISPECIES: hypothetical protein [unclassified Microcoleus]MCC3409807.1 hypothetical protein [Microcoleus sp. PH2017_10_PVI_O_A]MCC3482405.1 hypothetical protein [Microcoleus sp. PH2017_12_PCY_D_A]